MARCGAISFGRVGVLVTVDKVTNSTSMTGGWSSGGGGFMSVGKPNVAKRMTPTCRPNDAVILERMSYFFFARPFAAFSCGAAVISATLLNPPALMVPMTSITRP